MNLTVTETSGKHLAMQIHKFFLKKIYLAIQKENIFLKVILHQFWVKKIFPWKFNLEYGGTFIKLFMHVSSRNMFPTTRNLQICVHVYRPRHCCGDWLTFGCFVPMITDHDLVKKSFGPMMTLWRKDKQSWMLR
jgi:hypothetical protein